MKREKALLTAEQLSLILNISEFTVKKLAGEKELPCKYVNRRPRFDMDALLKHFQKLEKGGAA